MGDSAGTDRLIQWDVGEAGNQGTPRFLYMYVKSPLYIEGIGDTAPKWWPRPAHLIIYRTILFACVREYKHWPNVTIHEREFRAEEIEQAKAWCEIVWRMGK